jgi:hypothetical protein
MEHMQQRHVSQMWPGDDNDSLLAILTTHPSSSLVILVGWLEFRESGTLPLVSFRTTPCGAPHLLSRPASPHEIYMLRKWQDGVLCSFSMVEGYVDPCRLANRPRALLCVAAVVGTSVSIQSKASVNTRCMVR